MGKKTKYMWLTPSQLVGEATAQSYEKHQASPFIIMALLVLG